ncbi:MAG: hypothetical protein U0522_00255 [Candidatus Paceibacterota bacterium]
MKKLLTVLAFILLTPTLAFATSGACSGHGGVSCASGRDSDGSVICKDGWRNSSVQYSSMIMCASYDEPEKYIEPKIIEQKTTVQPIVEPIVAPVKNMTPVKTEVKKTLPVQKPVAEVVKTAPVEQKTEPVVQTKRVGLFSRIWNFIFQ